MKDLRRTSMKFLKRKSSLALVAMLVALLALPAFLNLNTKKVEAKIEASAVAADKLTNRSDLPVKPKGMRPQAPSGGTPPANDNCANAIAVTCASTPFTDTKNTDASTDEASEPESTCTIQTNSVWYTFTSGANASQVTVATCSSNFDTAIMAYKVTGGACDFANFTPVACNDDFCGDGLQSTVSFLADPNSTYKIQVGGFDGETGNLTVNITCEEFACAPIAINGTLGTGDPAFTGTQTHGTTVGRLNRNGIGSSCGAPKTCLPFDTTPGRAFDTYAIPNASGEDQCVVINLSAPANTTCNVQSNAYLTSFDGANICTNYLGDPGLSTGVPPTPTSFSVTVPAGQTLVVVVMTTNPGETGCPYTVNVIGDLCAGFDFCVQQDAPKRFLEVNSTTGAYRYTDCSKNIIRTGTGSAFEYFCKVDYSGSGTNSSASALFNPCTKKGDATIQVKIGNLTQTVKISDKDITNNDCQCATPQ
jgi:hypothetical protein